MGYDSYGDGAFSSSSSNLSAQATPFTADHVLNLNTNPWMNYRSDINVGKPPPPPPPRFIELPQRHHLPPPSLPTYDCAGIRDSSLPRWGFHTNPTTSISAMADYYTSFNSKPDFVPTRDKYLAPIAPLDTTAADKSGAFTHTPYADNATKTAVDTAKPYYSSHVSPALEKKESLGGVGDSTYGVLSPRALALLGSTSQGDCTEEVSGWSSLNRWEAAWNALKDFESGSCSDLKWGSNEKNAADPPLCMDYVTRQGPGATKYDKVKQYGNGLFVRQPPIGTRSSRPNIDLSCLDKAFYLGCLGVDYPHHTLNSNDYEVGGSGNTSRFNSHPENIGRDAHTSLTRPHSSNKSLSKASEPHLPQTGSPSRYSFNLNEFKVNDFVDNSSECLDPYKPAEDSPCWKGGFFGFRGSHISGHQPLSEEPIYARDISQELGENFTSNPSKAIENSLSLTKEKTSFCTSSNAGWDDSFTSTKPSPPVKMKPPIKIFRKMHSCSVEKEKNANESSGMGALHMPKHNADDITNRADLNEKESTPKIDLAAMIKTMQNLSDLLFFYCSNDECALEEQENVALEHVISNLNSCISKIPPSTPKRKSLFPVDLNQDAKVLNIDTANAIDNVNSHLAQDKKSHNMSPHTDDEECHDFCNAQNVTDIGIQDVMTQAIKKVLDEKFNCGEERLPQALLYKNLWLEAEAVICSTNLKARFDRVKSEVEKSYPPKMNVADELQDKTDMEKSLHSEVHPDVNLVSDLNIDMTSSIKNSPTISISSPRDDVLVRFGILKSREDKFTSASPTDNVRDVRSCDSDANSSIPDSPIGSTSNHEDDVIARLRILTSRGDGSASVDTQQTIVHPFSCVSPALKDVNSLPTNTRVQGSPLSSNTHDSADDAVMARLSILKSRDDYSSSTSPTYNVKDVSSCASDAKNSIPDSPIESTTNHEDGVIDRFRILTAQGDSSASLSTPQTVMQPFSCTFPALKDGNTLPADTCIQEPPLSSYSRGSNDVDGVFMARLQRIGILECHEIPIDEDKLNVDKTDLGMSFQSCNEDEEENQDCAGWYDGPSDWELVLNDDFVCQK